MKPRYCRFTFSRCLVAIRESRVGQLTLLLAAVLLLASPVMAQQSSSSSRIALRIIVVDAIQQADQICRRLSKGEDFAALATENSTDATNQQGGLMGKVDPSTLRPELRDALKHLNPAKRVPLSSFSSGGYAILKILFPSEWRNSPRSQERSKSLWMGKFRRKTKLRQYSICCRE